MGSTSLQRNATEEPSQNGDGDTSQGGAIQHAWPCCCDRVGAPLQCEA